MKRLKLRCHELNDFDMESKVKILFILKAPVDIDFLHELKAHGSVSLNGKDQIVRYKGNDGGLVLCRSTKHEEPEESDVEIIEEENLNPWNDINKSTIELKKEIIFEDSMDEPGDSEVNEWLEFIGEKIKKYREMIDKLEVFDKPAKVKQLFALSAPVDDGFLEELRQDATVEVDESNRITKYIANDESLQLEGLHDNETENDVMADEDADAIFRSEMADLRKFIAEKCENADLPLTLVHMLREYKEVFGCRTKIKTLQERLKRHRKTLHKRDDIDLIGKVKQMFVLSVPVDSAFLKLLRKNATVEVDRRNQIIKYKANNGSLKLKGGHPQSKPRQSVGMEEDVIVEKVVNTEETNDLITFIIEKCENTDRPLNLLQLAEEFREKSGLTTRLSVLKSRIERYRRSIPSLDMHPNMRGIQLFALGYTVDKRLLAELRQHAIVEIDARGKIVEYESNDGEVRLQGEHNSRLATNESPVRRTTKRRSCNSYNTPRYGSENRIVKTESDEFWRVNVKTEAPEEEDVLSEIIVDTDERGSIERQFDYEEIEEPVEKRRFIAPQVEMGDNRYEENSFRNDYDELYEPIETKPTFLFQPVSLNKSTSTFDLETAPQISISSSPGLKRENSDKRRLVSIEDHTRFLDSILQVIRILDLPVLKSQEYRIEARLEKFKVFGNKEEKVTFLELRASISTCLLIVQKSSMKEFGGESASVKDFLLILRTSLFGMKISILDESQQQIKNYIERLSVIDEKIPIKKLKSALRALLDIVAP
uniref:SPK domain-containing protein n=1 Tax=Caenorhabditis tropicalis TaxID=1561998 RepID=A0A1I7SZA5_9PELO